MKLDNFDNLDFISGSAKAILSVLLVVITLQSYAFAQTERIRSYNLEDLRKQQAAPTAVIPASEKVLLDKKIDPKTYVLGPGDVLSVFTWGYYQGQYTLTVSPEGMLLIPEVGPIEVSGYTLENAADIISAGILERYRNVKTIVSLVNLRVFKVFIGGAVAVPGAYPATPVTRVSEVIEMAGGFLGEEEGVNYKSDFRGLKSDKRIASKRNIEVVRENGERLKADILRFEITGQTKYNPRLNNGDKIFVPLQELGINLYGIFGAVKNPGYFEYSERDSLADLIELAHGLALNADSHNVEIVRFHSDNRSTHNVNVDLISHEWNTELRPDDRVYIQEIRNFHEKYQVRLIGEFKFPGYYAITQDSTHLSEIVTKAGGFTDLASLQEAEMYRISAEEIVDPEFERLKKMEVADMSESEYEYFKVKSRSKMGRVSVDFTGLFTEGDTTKDFILRDGDIIRVPRKSKVVNVIGEVSNPGILSYVPGMDYRFYIGRSGGFSDRADKGGVSVIDGITGEWQKAKRGKNIEPGDTIWISEKKKRDYWGFIKDTLVFVGNLATVYLVIQQATK
ncbi:MAG: SLBB domain-containing protein [Candidatus Zixiibacteriota bacterium]|nr:MAG: SLBB domain-containing protein [candidate division Zixibacteria bacterium]